MDESNKQGELLPGCLVRIFADNAYHGLGLVLEVVNDDDDARRVLLKGKPLLFWRFELEEVPDEV
jgi:hypothetical protein